MAAKGRKKAETVTVEAPSPGKDELNLAEFPISVLADRAPKGTKTLIYKDRQGQLTVTGSDAFGLPTALDTDVIVALIQLSKRQNDLKEPTVNFTRYELLRLLGWANEGKSYRRLDESLNRWAGVTLYYDNCWWDNRSKQYGDAKIHILESVIILDGTARSTENGNQQALPLSSFTWNKVFMESFQAGNLKNLDIDTYFSLNLATTKQLYRFLDKRFWNNRPTWTFDLEELAFDRVGLSRNYTNVGKIKEKLDPAIKELEDRDFLQPMSREERYFKDGKTWKIRLIQKLAPSPALEEPAQAVLPAEPPPLVAALVQRGVTESVATDLVARHAAEAVAIKIDVFDFLNGKNDKKIEKNPAGWLVKSIANDYAPPKGYQPKAERERKAEAKRQAELKAIDERRRKQSEAERERRLAEQVEAFRKSQTPEQLAELEAAAIAQADEQSRQNLDEPHMKQFRKTLLHRMTSDHIARLILADAKPVEPA